MPGGTWKGGCFSVLSNWFKRVCLRKQLSYSERCKSKTRGLKEIVTMVGIASACGYLAALGLAKWLYTYVEKNDTHMDFQLGTALVDMFSRCGDPSSALHVFKRMEKRDVSACPAVIGVEAMEGNTEGSIELFNEMIKQNGFPLFDAIEK